MEKRVRRWTSSSLQAIRDLVPMALRYRLWRARMLLAFPHISPTGVEQIFIQLAAKIDLARLENLHRRHLRAPPDLRDACDYEVKLRIAIVKAMVLGLHESPPKKILDIGWGGGYFVAVCRHLGHTASGTEVPLERLSPTIIEAYDEISAALRCDCEIRLYVQAKQPVVLPALYDLITAHKICFNDHMKPTQWGVAPWKFAIEDLKRYLAPGGQLLLELNESVARYGARRWYDDELFAYFQSVGKVVGNRITIAQR